MKKGLLAVAVAGALSLGAAQAETVLYGSLRMSYNNVKVTGQDRISDMNDETSRVGIKGSEDLGNGIKILFQAEWRTPVMEGFSNNGDFKNRLGWIGIAGDFGTVKIGRQWSPIWSHGISGNIKDDFHASVASQTAADLIINDVAFLNWAQGTGITRLGNSISYETPNLSGFKAIAMVTMDDTAPELQVKKHVDIYQLAASYNHESGFYGKLGYAQGYVDVDKSRVWSAQLGYKVDQFGVTVGYTDGKHKGTFKAKGWDIGASYSFGNDYASTVRAGYGHAKIKPAAGGPTFNKATTWALGFEQKLSSRTLVWAEYGHTKDKYANGSIKQDGISLGIRHDF